MKKLKCIIVDDEPLARNIIQKFVEQNEALELCANLENAIDALNYINENPVDLIFLDIQMPELNGIDFMKTLVDKPMIIMTTSDPSYALECYEYSVVDYLLKPITLQRFLKGVNKALTTYNKAPLEEVETNKEEGPSLIVKENGINHRLFFDEIYYVEAFGNYLKIHHPNKVYIQTETMIRIMEQLDERFVRIHKSFITNTDKIQKMTSNRVQVNGVELPIGNTYKNGLRDKMSKVVFQ
ncbi:MULTISPECIES: LytR/AlgR family response regulator transcription factor [Persicobacter]|uniref:DNA-binding response regulator n=1 Tax=Persicobacter diffluens TaxID=981 RepID=A0AAN4VWF6_9BACT|nr:response regulator transcription factor [Persicobacter sp. CCB-QB2]GJM60197.1 DNA-binding response regulator [Persicobacter diffluens]